MVSHELRSPLNLILGFSRLMVLSPESYGEALPRPYREDMDAIYRNSQHLLALIDDILDLSQIEMQRLPLVKDRIDWKEDVINKVIDTARPLAARKGLYLKTCLEPNIPWILADPIRLRQVLMNLLTNAIRLTERGGITITTQCQEDSLLVSVSDTGPGIPAEVVPHLFREFSQVSPARDGEKSTGLGLSICKHLVNLHGGTIWVESEMGKRTTFFFTIPLPATGLDLGGTIRTETPSHVRALSTCLVVHDDPRVTRLLGRQLTDWRIMGIPNDREVLALTQELHPQAIVTAPRWVEGISRQLASTPFDVPLIACGLPSTAEQTGLDGIVSYVVKPVAAEVINALMERVIRERDRETTILLVDDDPDAVRLLERILLALPHSYHLLEAYDGARAWQLIQEHIPDIAFVDLFMPQVDGYELIRRMRSDQRTHGIPVVVTSAHDWTEEEASVSTPITITCRQPLNMAQATQCLQALLATVHADYLAGSTMPQSSAT